MLVVQLGPTSRITIARPFEQKQVNADSSEYFLFDEFEGNTLNTSKWNSETDEYSTITVSDGILTLETDTPSEWHAHEEIGFTDVIIKHGETHGVELSNAVSIARRHIRTYSAGSDFLTKSVAPDKTWFTAEIHWISDTEVIFIINDKEYIHTTSIPTEALPIGIFTRVIYAGPGTHFGGVIKSKVMQGQPGVSLRMRIWMDATPDGDDLIDGGTIQCDWIYLWNSSLEDPNNFGNDIDNVTSYIVENDNFSESFERYILIGILIIVAGFAYFLNSRRTSSKPQKRFRQYIAKEVDPKIQSSFRPPVQITKVCAACGLEDKYFVAFCASCGTKLPSE